MKGQKKAEWIEKGYTIAASEGIKNIRIESIARELDKNKSSFYHYFGDLESFENELLAHHIAEIKELAIQLARCKSMRPDVLNLFILQKTDLFFHKQLRINRSVPRYKACFEQAFQILEDAVIQQWSTFLGLKQRQLFARTFFQLIADNFLLQITEDNFNYEWISQYLDEIHSILQRMNSN
ncbi:MAG: AcrR family transcriptional regulator [Chitinophagales bacterium]|jgi:AcrR family transcriptional regulator